jgi:hypothetical protein
LRTGEGRFVTAGPAPEYGDAVLAVEVGRHGFYSRASGSFRPPIVRECASPC